MQYVVGYNSSAPRIGGLVALSSIQFIMNQLFHFTDSVRRAPAVESWLREQRGELGAIAKCWFQIMRDCGADVREILHDGHPTACVTDAAFAYVDTFKAHVNVGFYRGAKLNDPDGLLHGAGKMMRHVKLRPDDDVDDTALEALIRVAYADMKRCLATD